MPSAAELHLDIEPWHLYPLEPQNDQEGEGEAYVLGSLDDLAQHEAGPLIRVHSECLFGDVLAHLSATVGPNGMPH